MTSRFWVIRCHRLRDHSIPSMPFPRGAHCPVVTESLSQAVFEITGLKDIGVITLTLQDHVTSSMTSSFDPAQAISY